MPARKGSVVDVTVPTINVINKSTQVNDANFQLMVEAVTTQLNQQVAPMWLRGTWKIVTNQPDTVGYPIVILDSPDQAGVLGYHTESPGGKVWGRVFVNPVLKNNGTLLSGALSVSAVLSHEVIEAYCDPNVNLWADMGNSKMVAFEACDPVENDFYQVTTKNGTKVSVSNFVLPAWFDSYASLSAKFDWLAVVAKPLTMSKGGYMVVLDTKTDKVTNVFGSMESERLHNLRQDPHPAARSARKASSASKRQ